MNHGVMRTCAAFTACSAIYLFIVIHGESVPSASAVYDFEMPYIFVFLSSSVVSSIATDPGVVRGQSVLSGVDGSVQAGEVWLQLP